jgi:single-stranded-DNA-specific exonuclease
MDGPVPALADRALACATQLRDADSVLLVSHIDADGLTSAAVATQALARAGITFEVAFEKQLDDAAIRSIAATDYETVLFTDFGSGQLETIAAHESAGEFTPVICDHHQPAAVNTDLHLNPLLFDIDGAAELSGAGTTYVLARALAESAPRDGKASAEPTREIPRGDGGTLSVSSAAGATENRDLAALAVVGAVGDMQGGVGGLTGANEGIVAEGIEAGVLAEATDLAFYGKQTRPLPKLLQYASDVRIPGISGSERGCFRFLDGLDIDLKRDGEWCRWVDLTAEERRELTSALIQHAISRGVPADRIEELVGTSYRLLEEPAGTELRDASEFSTLLNATARYERADVGLAVCLGYREGALTRAQTLLSNHRRNLSAGIEWVTTSGVTTEEHLQWFHAGDEIRDTIVGIVAGMALGSDGISREKPIIAFANESDEQIKTSARASAALVRRGVDLAAVMERAAKAVDGAGGGHDVAAGATVPRGSEAVFIEAADAALGEQLG